MSENRVAFFWQAKVQKPVPPREAATQAGALCYRRGVEAMEKQDWGLASYAFREAVMWCPHKLNFRQLLINCFCKLHGDNKSGSASLNRLKLASIHQRVRQALEDRSWHRADFLCQEGLAINPWDVELHIALAAVARAQGFLDIAKFSLAFARQMDRRSREINLRLIQVLREMGDHDEADRIQRRLDDLDEDGEDGAAQGVS